MTTRVAIIWNPTKTDKHQLEAALADAVGEAPPPETRWWETTQDDPGQGAAENALADGADLLVVAGGDGTVRAVAEHLAEVSADAELGIIPLGTGNLLARNLDVPINDVSAAFARALEPDTRPVDVGWVEVELAAGRQRHAFLVMVGFGIDAQMIVETDEDLKDTAGWLAYVESLGRALSESDVVAFRVAKDDQPEHDEEGHTLLIANCGTLQGGVTLLPDADPTDGELDYLLLRATNLGGWLDTLKTMVWDNGLKRLVLSEGEVASSESAEQGRAVTLAATLAQPRAFEIDGEEIGETTAFSVTIQRAAIRVR